MGTRALPVILTFNRGAISPLALARVDIKRTAMSAERMVNYMPRVLGPMRFRAGLGYKGATLDNAQAKYLPFVFSSSDRAIVELTNQQMRVWVEEAPISRPAVSTTVTNGNFTTDLTGWTDNDEAGATSSWATGGYMQLLGDGTNSAIRSQTVTVATADQNVRHALRVVIERGPVVFRVGSTSGGEEYVAESELAVGEHSLSFVPTGASVYLQFSSALNRIVLVDSCNVEAEGDMILPTPWVEDDLYLVRWDQSGDVIFVACTGYAQYRIERRAVYSWSVVQYLSNDGPFRATNTDAAKTITASATTGNITLASSKPTFKSTQVGALYRMTSTGQLVSAAISSENTFTDPIRVIGTGDARRYSFEVTGTWTGTVTLQRSVGVLGAWEDLDTYTSNTTQSNNDGLDNQEVYYRVGVKTGDYGSGTVNVTMNFALGSKTGVVRITGYTNESAVNAEVLTALGSTDPTDDWAEGAWSERRGYPSSVALYEGRLWWGGKDHMWGSVSDAFDSFDPDYEGDAGPINRTIGSGPVDSINFLLPLNRLIIGTAAAEFSARSNAFDQPLTPSNFNIKAPSTQGSAPVIAVKVDSRGIFVHRCGSRVYELDVAENGVDYISRDLTVLNPEICEPGIVTLAVQRKPDTRIHAVLSDGTVAVAVIDGAENVLAWQKMETDGLVEDVVVLPDVVEDAVYYCVNRSLTNFTKQGFVNAINPTWAEYTPVNLGVQVAIQGTFGSSYAVGDVLTVVGGTYTRPAQVMVVYAPAGLAVAFAVVDPGDYSGFPGTPADLSGGSGTGAQTYLQFGTGTLVGIDDGAGVDYTSPPSLSFSGGNGAGAAATASSQLIAATVFAFGAGYTTGDILTASGGTFTRPAILRADVVITGQIVGWGIIDPGSYTVTPSAGVAVTGGTGTGAQFTPYYGIGDCTVTDGGDGYTVAPTITVTGGGGSGGQLSCTVDTSVVEVPGTYTHRFLERWALESECVGGTLNKQADAFATYSGIATLLPTGFDHLNGRYVIAWADGRDISTDDDAGVQTTYLVSGGHIVIPTSIGPVSQVVVGLAYTAQWKSSKLAFAAPEGTVLAQRKTISQIGLVLAYTQRQAIRYGPSFDYLDPMPAIEEGADVSADHIYSSYDGDMVEFPGSWSTDERVCLETKAPRPATVMGLVIAIEGNIKS